MRDPIIISEGNMTVSVWSFEDPLWSGTSGCEECQGAMVVADSLSYFADGVETSQKAFRTLRNAGKEPTTFHFVLTGNEQRSLELSPAAKAYLQDCKFPALFMPILHCQLCMLLFFDLDIILGQHLGVNIKSLLVIHAQASAY